MPYQSGWKENQRKTNPFKFPSHISNGVIPKKRGNRRYVQKYIWLGILLFLVCCLSGGFGIPANNKENPVESGMQNDDNSSLIVKRSTFSHRGRDSYQIFTKKDIRLLLNRDQLTNLNEKTFPINIGGRGFYVETTLDIELQRYLLEKMNPSYARYIGLVVMNPHTGRILAMVSFDKEKPGRNTCLYSGFPAASIFKIITAAAAIEKYGFNSESNISFTGGKYTLYKYQLKEQSRYKGNEMTLRNSFAQSVNPVFGKLGMHYLKKTALQEYAMAFGFNRLIECGIPLSPSMFSISEEPYNWAEIASGFNRETTISPLHGAMIASTVLNHGLLLEPVIIDRIFDDKGKTLYQSKVNQINRPISSRTSMALYDMMTETVLSGTCRKTFRGYDKDEILCHLDIGGKTGSINNTNGTIRYDWFVGFSSAKPARLTPKGGSIAVAAVIAHEAYMGINSRQYARMIMEEYFGRYAPF